MPSIRAGRPVGEVMRRRMRATLKSLARDLEAASGGMAIHPARKRLKAARSLLRMLRPALGNDTFHAGDDALRQAARALEPLRHSEAMGEAVRKLAAVNGSAPDLLALAETVDARLSPGDSAPGATEPIDQATAALLPLRAHVAAWKLPKHDVTLFVEGMRQCYARARKYLNKGLAARDAVILHEARKSVIHHYHHLDLLKALWPRLFKVWIDDLRSLRESLGDLHDLEELQKLLAVQDSIAGRATRDAAEGAIAARRTALFADVAAASGRLFAEKPRAFAARIAALWTHQANHPPKS
ncbi:CHAD domain-containing protein [soil metagenome]